MKTPYGRGTKLHTNSLEFHVGLSKPESYGDLEYKLKKIVDTNISSAQFSKTISHYKKIGYTIKVLRQTAFHQWSVIWDCHLYI